MVRFIIDANLPYYFSIWNNEEYIHVKDINDEWTDEQIWKYAQQNDLTIITKDSDFSNKILFQSPPPKVIHLRIGNMKLKEFLDLIDRQWTTVMRMNDEYKLINVFKDRIEGIK